jgi:hypothetical protein
MLRSHGDSGIYDGIQADAPAHSASERESVPLPDLAVRREQQVVLRPCVHRQARHYEFDVDRHVVHTDQEIQINWEHQYIFTARPKVVPRPSIMRKRAIKKAGSSGQHHRRNDRHDDRRQRHDSHEDVPACGFDTRCPP